jgi:DNA-binding MarR family transcriptional regulator
MIKIVREPDLKELAKENFPKAYLYSLHQIYILVQKHMEKKLGKENKKSGNLTFSQFWVLVCFIDCQNQDEQTASVVAKKMHISEATLSGHIERLLKQKLIIKKVDKNNRRKSIITLTEKGNTAFKNSKKVIEDELDKIFNVVNKSDREKVLDAQSEILKKLKELN